MPGLILMDVQLPKISGLEATRRLRAEPATADTPIIAITSFALSGDEQRAKEAGASDYLPKPFSPFVFLGMIESSSPKREWCRGGKGFAAVDWTNSVGRTARR